MINFSQNNGNLSRSDTYLIRQNIYAISNERAQIYPNDQQEMRHQLRQAYISAIPPVPSPNPNIEYEQEVKALKRIFKTWRRGNSLISNLEEKTCSIWLGDFEDRQVLIQLKWNHSHWFHYEWIRKWATTNDTWPIWRANYVEVAHKEIWRSEKLDRLSMHSISYEQSV